MWVGDRITFICQIDLDLLVTPKFLMAHDFRELLCDKKAMISQQRDYHGTLY